MLIGSDVFRTVGREDIEFTSNFGKVIVGVAPDV